MAEVKDAAYWARLHVRTDRSKPVDLPDTRFIGKTVLRSKVGGLLKEQKL